MLAAIPPGFQLWGCLKQFKIQNSKFKITKAIENNGFRVSGYAI